MATFYRLRLIGVTAALTTFVGLNSPVQAQIAVGLDLAAPIAPLNAITVPDVNALGILDGQGPIAGAELWSEVFGGAITNQGQRPALQQLGKALFWDMQVGGDGIQSCASCHYHAGADNRITNQMSPGLKMTFGGPDVPASNSDTMHDLYSMANATLVPADFTSVNVNGDPVGLPVDEAALIAAGSTPDEIDGTSGVPGVKPDAADDVNDVISSQGVRSGQYGGLSGGPVDAATLNVDDPGFDGFSGFTVTQNDTSVETVHTVRRVEPRNSPTAVNAVYHMRNFWDGRADMFFNGVTPLGFRDPNSTVKVYSGATLSDTTLRIPFSSLASQAVGPIESDFEMVFAGRPHRDLGKKLLAAGVVPLAGQAVSDTDSLLGGLVLAGGRGLDKSYSEWIAEVFDERFWGDGFQNDVCLGESGDEVECLTEQDLSDDGVDNPTLEPNPDAAYTLMEWNFSLFFGLAVQAYEATLTTEQTIVDLLVGGIATGQVVNQTTDNRGRIRSTVTVPVTALPLQACIAAAALNNNAAQQAVATTLCTQHYAQWIHPLATAGSQAGNTGTPVDPGTAIGGCATPNTPTTALNGVVQTPWCGSSEIADVQNAVAAIDRGMGRFFAGATGCSICHFNPEFTGATVAALTGFGAAPPPPLPPGQLRRLPLEVPMERMIAFNGAPAVYDAGFYNLGIRPTPEDIALGDQIGGVPLAFSKLAEQIQLYLQAGNDTAAVEAPYNGGMIATIQGELASGTDLFIPTSALDLTPRPWTLALACGPGLVGNGNGNGNNNPNAQCVTNVIPGERLLRNGAFKAQGLRNVKFTGPYFHNGAMLNLSQVVNTYETAGHFTNLNFNNLDAGLRIFDVGPTDTASLVELMETGLTDWRLAHEEGKFDHPEICVPHGHDATSGETILVGIPAVGQGGNAAPLQTFEEQVIGTGPGASHVHNLTDDCTVPGVSTLGLSDIDTPPAPTAPAAPTP